MASRIKNLRKRPAIEIAAMGADAACPPPGTQEWGAFLPGSLSTQADRRRLRHSAAISIAGAFAGFSRWTHSLVWRGLGVLLAVVSVAGFLAPAVAQT
ncbi:MAG: hypothetical protein M3Y28_08090, partial [Armatimonadota bacterium]|nr:hypothetical protein [Armatimonadota bacterium]